MHAERTGKEVMRGKLLWGIRPVCTGTIRKMLMHIMVSPFSDMSLLAHQRTASVSSHLWTGSKYHPWHGVVWSSVILRPQRRTGADLLVGWTLRLLLDCLLHKIWEIVS